MAEQAVKFESPRCCAGLLLRTINVDCSFARAIPLPLQGARSDTVRD